jgi:hypothetical protein
MPQTKAMLARQGKVRTCQVKLKGAGAAAGRPAGSGSDRA